jgi:monofunctional biosynthetic peptidoglycan transglycosylase
MKFSFKKKIPGLSFRRIAVGLLSIGLLVLVGAALYVYFTLPDVTVLLKENPKRTALMQQRLDEAAEKGRRMTIRQQWIGLKQTPALFKNMIRITEDGGFYDHEGVDFEELKESLKRNWEEGRFSRGGSTITQQLAKNLYLSTEKSVLRKVKEYFIARRLEAELSKDRIFEIYINIIELGNGLFGVQAAARQYFKRDVGELSAEQMIRLTAIIPRPLRTDPTGSGRWLRWKSKWILTKLKQYKYLSETQYDEILPAFN